VFKAYQTYQGGETVAWVNASGEQQPAPVVQVGSVSSATATDDHGAAPAAVSTRPGANPTANAAAPTAGAVATAPLQVDEPSAVAGSDATLVATLGALALAAVSLALAIVALLRRPRAA
jgi:hypothetical protein